MSFLNDTVGGEKFIVSRKRELNELVDAIMRRTDKDMDELITYLDFMELIQPSTLFIESRSPYLSPSRDE